MYTRKPILHEGNPPKFFNMDNVRVSRKPKLFVNLFILAGVLIYDFIRYFLFKKVDQFSF